MGKIAVIGKYNTKVGFADGQAVKTRIITKFIEAYFGVNEVTEIDTYNWKKRFLIPTGLHHGYHASCWCS